MHRFLAAVVSAGVLSVAACDSADPTAPMADVEVPGIMADGSSSVIRVTNPDDSGAGTLRAALEAAGADSRIRTISFKRGLPPIQPVSPLVFKGSQHIVLDGNRAEIDGTNCACSGLQFVGSGGLTAYSLTVRNAGGGGIVVDIPSNASGSVRVYLNSVNVLNNGLHGVHVNDQASESAANIVFQMVRSRVVGNGFAGDSDYDGVRVDEGGAGSIIAAVNSTRILANGADGLELDERGPGDVILSSTSSQYNDNGPKDPADLDDGLDIDEADGGSIRVKLRNVRINNNKDEGLDLDEAGPGDLQLEMVRVWANGNGSEADGGDGIKADEEDEGSLWVEANRVTASGNYDEGFQVGEEGLGDVKVQLVNSTFDRNVDRGIQVEQEDDGSGVLRLRRVKARGNDEPMKTKGVEVQGSVRS